MAGRRIALAAAVAIETRSGRALTFWLPIVMVAEDRMGKGCRQSRVRAGSEATDRMCRDGVVP
jgi:hypothetical protein